MAPRLRHKKPKRTAWQTLLELGQREGQSAPGVTARISRFSTATLDVDNFVGGTKYLIDQLRYCGLIPGDRPQEITLAFAPQVKVQHQNEAGTLVEIFFEGQTPANSPDAPD
jgi:hypothetical protein